MWRATGSRIVLAVAILACIATSKRGWQLTARVPTVPRPSAGQAIQVVVEATREPIVQCDNGGQATRVLALGDHDHAETSPARATYVCPPGALLIAVTLFGTAGNGGGLCDGEPKPPPGESLAVADARVVPVWTRAVDIPIHLASAGVFLNLTTPYPYTITAALDSGSDTASALHVTEWPKRVLIDAPMGQIAPRRTSPSRSMAPATSPAARRRRMQRSRESKANDCRHAPAPSGLARRDRLARGQRPLAQGVRSELAHRQAVRRRWTRVLPTRADRGTADPRSPELAPRRDDRDSGGVRAREDGACSNGRLSRCARSTSVAVRGVGRDRARRWASRVSPRAGGHRSDRPAGAAFRRRPVIARAFRECTDQRPQLGIAASIRTRCSASVSSAAANSSARLARQYVSAAAVSDGAASV